MHVSDHFRQKENKRLGVSNDLFANSEQQMAEINAGMNPNAAPEEIQMKPEVQKNKDEELLTGTVFFSGCDNQLENFFMIPEHEGAAGFHPTRRRVSNVDGFWFKNHTPGNEWWKIPGLATTYVHCNENDEQNPDITPATITPFFTSGWSDDEIHTPNPY